MCVGCGQAAYRARHPELGAVTAYHTQCQAGVFVNLEGYEHRRSTDFPREGAMSESGPATRRPCCSPV
jgi:hypothetical protein